MLFRIFVAVCNLALIYFLEKKRDKCKNEDQKYIFGEKRDNVVYENMMFGKRFIIFFSFFKLRNSFFLT